MGTSVVVLTQVALVFLVFLFIFLVLDPNVLFLWHPSLMMLSFGFMMSEGVIVSRFIKSSQRAFWAQLHYYIQFSAVILAILGVLTVIYHKIIDNRPHFETWHSLMGLITLIATLFQALLGIRMHYSPRITIGSLQMLMRMRELHRKLGTFSYLFSIATIAFGIYAMQWHEGVWMGQLMLVLFVGVFSGLALHIIIWMPKKTIRRVDEELENDDSSSWPQHV